MENQDNKSARKDRAEFTTEQQDRIDRIKAAAAKLAHEGGYEAVRLRDVADAAEVAMATLYRYFRCKEEILLAIMSEEYSTLEDYLRQNPPEGETPMARAMVIFRLLTKAMAGRPGYTRATLRALSSGQPSTAPQVSALHNRLASILLNAIRDCQTDPLKPGVTLDQLEPDQAHAWMLDRIWFTSIMGWAGGALDEDAVLKEITAAAKLLLEGEFPSPA
ncbi:MAG: TetR/AcrR family transcriptional regulator [Deltaproteobacteria bacterium]|nr:TetR/AcrR family transcriptional regulator [Deltaproteobacteria bacterium]